LLFTYQILRIRFPTDMADQPSIDYQEGPRLLPAAGSVSIDGLRVDPDGLMTNPVASDQVSLQRGKVLYSLHCQLCHGDQGHGDGPLAHYFDRPPQNLTDSKVAAEADGSVYLTIVQGFGEMPALSENLTPRESWDVINYLRTLTAQ
jgi:mono/diheme cytochrome c family protein